MENRKKRSPFFLLKIFNNKKLLSALIIFFISYLFLIFNNIGIFNLDSIDFNSNDIINTLSIASMIISISLVTLNYLQGNRNEITNIRIDSLKKDEDKEQISILNEQISQIENLIKTNDIKIRDYLKSSLEDFKNNSSNEFKLSEDSEIISNIKETISNNLNNDFFVEVNRNFSSALLDQRKKDTKELINTSRATSLRLTQEIDKLDRKSNANLVYGSALTIVALIFLIIVVYDKPNSQSFTNDMFIHYIPRISLIIFIEVFAFFFLRLYKLNLIDIKYYQNELTNVELKVSAMLASINFGLEQDLSLVVSDLSKTERNFILEKGQTTVDFEKFKYDQKSLEKFAKIFKDIIPKSK